MLKSPTSCENLAPPTALWVRVVETFLLAAIVPVARLGLGSSDPFLLRGDFPWLLMIPLLLSVEHGLAAGVWSWMLLGAGAWLHVASGGGAFPESTVSWAIASFLVVAIAGRAGAARVVRAARAGDKARKLQAAIARERRARQVLRLLQRRLMAAPHALLAAMDEAERRVRGGRSWSEAARAILEALQLHAEIRCASVFVARPDRKGFMQCAAAKIGAAPEDDPQHVLIQCALRSGEPAIRTELDESGADGSVLAALPFMDADGRLLGVVAVHELPLQRFHPHHLGQVTLILRRLARCVAADLAVESLPSIAVGAARRNSIECEATRARVSR